MQENEQLSGGRALQTPKAIMAAKAELWGGIWGRDEAQCEAFFQQYEELAATAAEQLGAWGPLTLPMLKAAIGRTPAGTGLGVDRLSPCYLKALPQQGLQGLLGCLASMEASMALPDRAMLNMVALLDKPAGGDRPISLMAMPYRVWLRMRRYQVAAWDREHAGPWDCAVAGVGAVDAAFISEAQTEAAVLAGRSVGGALLDMAKFYDHVDLSILGRDALRHDYPLPVLLLGLQAYLAPRMLKKGALMHEGVQPWGGIIAGCAQATSCARLYLWDPLREANSIRRGLTAREFVDDILVKAIGTATFVKTVVPEALVHLFELLRGKKCQISDKSKVLASSLKLASSITDRLAVAGVHFEVARTGRDLGVDTTFGRRRTVPIARGRRQKATFRVSRMAKLLKVTRKARKLYPAGAQAQALWGGQIGGIAPTTLRKLRTDAARATGILTRGLCTTTAIRLCFGAEQDPLIKARAQLLGNWAKMMAKPGGLLQQVRGVWRKAQLRLGTQADRIWKRVRGPITAVIATLRDLDWKSPFPDEWIDFEGQRWQAGGSDLTALTARVAQSVERQVWPVAATHPQGAGLERGADLVPATRLVRGLSRAGCAPDAALVEHIAAGAMWGDLRRHQAGYRADGVCRRCRQALDDDFHRVWACPCNEQITSRHVQGTQTMAAEALQEGQREHACFWVRGIVPLSWYQVPEPSAQRTRRLVAFPAAAPLRGGVYATDGSGGKYSQDPLLRRCGWAWVQMIEGKPGFAKFGCLEGPKQSVPRAELVAVAEVVRETVGDVEVLTDHLNIVKGFRKGASATALADNSDLWEELWAAVGQHQGTVRVTKVPAHADTVQKVIAAGLDEWPDALVGNFVADALSGRAAYEAEVASEAAKAVKALREKATLILRRIAAITREISKLPRERHREVVPPRTRLAPGMKLSRAKQETTHQVTSLGRRWRCVSCYGTSPGTSQVAWFLKACPGRQGDPEQFKALRAPHPSHVMSRSQGFVWCSVCGAWSKVRYRKALLGECRGRPPGAYHLYALSRLRRGLEPFAVPRRAAVDELELV